MLDSDFSIQDQFPAADLEQWRKLAAAGGEGKSFEQSLVTCTREGIDLQPLYTREQISFTDINQVQARAARSDLRQEHATPQLELANRALCTDLAGGVDSLHLVLARAAQAGLDPDEPRVTEYPGIDGVMAYHVEEWEQLLAGVELSKVEISWEAGSAFLPVAALWFALCERRQLPPNQASGALNADPIAALARQGRLPYSLEDGLNQLTDLAQWALEFAPRVTTVGVDVMPYHCAGATATQDLAFGLATAVEYLRALNGAGISIEVAASQILFRLPLHSRHFLSIAKLRAARRLWARLLEACGTSATAAPMRIHARLGDEELTQGVTHWNQFRNTAAVFAAVVGGADAITSVPFNHATGHTCGFSRRLARNTATILQQEAGLHRVNDPAVGSWFLERYTRDLAERAWAIFQQIEQQSGMIDALQNGWVAEQLRVSPPQSAKKPTEEMPDLLAQQSDALPVDAEKLHESAIVRIAAVRKSPAPQEFAPQQDLTTAAIEAATQGATLGQIAKALGFQKETCVLSDLIEARSE